MHDLYSADTTQRKRTTYYADCMAPTLQQELDHTDHTDHTDQESIYPP